MLKYQSINLSIKYKIADFGCTVISKENKMAILISGKTRWRDIKSCLFTRLV